MKHFMRFFALVALGLISYNSPREASAASLPTSVISKCQQRSDQIQNISIVWAVARQEQVEPVPAKQIPAMQQHLAQGLVKSLRARGVTDPTILEKDVQSLVDQMTSQWKGINYSSVTTWRFSGNSGKTLVLGQKSVGSSDVGFEQLYSGDSCLVVNSSQSFSGQINKPDNPFVWAAPGNAVMYRCPLLGKSLDLSPAHFAMLMGQNPLTMFGAHWTLANTTAKDWILHAEVDEGVLSPATLQLSLSRSHDAAPDEIEITGPGYEEKMQALSWRHYAETWICDKATYVKEMPGVDTIKEGFVLQNVTTAGPIQLPQAPNSTVEDYRLLGPDFIDPHQFIPAPSSQQASQVVYYPWNGKLPSIDQLKQLFQQQHPGEATPDPNGKTSMLPTVGGLLCLVGGILTYRRRGKSV